MQTNNIILAAQPFLKGLSQRHLEVLAGSAMPAEFKTGELIFSEGVPANRFYLLLSGKVALESPPEQCDDERKPVLIETIGAGNVLGWSWLFPPYFWHFDPAL
jgi:CRP/FNR family cyclic AMP-dependent transcriptional regulator